MLLITSKPKRLAEDLSDMFNFMGILSVAAPPSEVPFEISEVYRAVLVLTPHTIYDEKEFSELVHAYGVPLFSFSNTESCEGYDLILKENLSAAEIFEAVSGFCREHGFKIPGEYRNEYIDASVNRQSASFCSLPLPLTKTELMIARTLLRFDKAPIKAKEILKFAFRNARVPDEASIRTHISLINKKTSDIFGKKLIFTEEKRGYRIFCEDFAAVTT